MADGSQVGRQPDFATIENYIALLTGDANTPMCWRFLPDGDTEKTRVAAYEKAERERLGDPKFAIKRNFDGTLADVGTELALHQTQGWGAFVVVNEGGRNSASIVRVRALFVDADGIPLSSVKWHLEPDFIVKRDETHWHAYWRVIDCPPHEFAKAQLRLASHYKTDPSVKDLPRVLRVPGTWHYKCKDGAPPLLVSFQPLREWFAPHRLADVVTGLPELLATPKSDERNAPEGIVPDADCSVIRAKTEIARAIKANEIANEGIDGNSAVRKLACSLKNLGISRELAKDLLWSDFNPHCNPPWQYERETFDLPIDSAYDDRKVVFGRDYVAPPEKVFSGYMASIDAPTLGDQEDDEPQDIFDNALSDAPPTIPSGALPRIIEDYAADEARRKGVDQSTVAFSAIIAAGAALHTEFQIQPTNDTTWLQRPVLWGMLVGGPSTVKTPILSAVTKPLEAIQESWFNQDKILHAQRKNEIEQWQAQRKKHLANISVAGIEVAGAMTGAQHSAEPTLPPMRRLLIKNSTIEALANLLANNDGRGVLCYRNELAGWITSFDSYRENKGQDKAHYLEAWDSIPQLIDRVSKDGPTFIKHWSVSILGGIQPGRLAPWAKQLTTDGLLQRFLVAETSLPGLREDRAPDANVYGAYHALMHRLAEVRAIPEAGRGIVPVRLSPEARTQWQRVDQHIRDAMTIHASREALSEHLAKWPNQFARLLLVMHAIDCVADATVENPYPKVGPLVSGATAERAAQLAIKFLIPSAIRFYRSVFRATETWTDAQWIADYMLTRDTPMRVIRPRDIYNNHHELMGKPKELQDAMRVLEEWGWIRPKEITQLRGVTEWHVNPKVYARFAARAAAEKVKREKTKAAIKAAAARYRSDIL